MKKLFISLGAILYVVPLLLIFSPIVVSAEGEGGLDIDGKSGQATGVCGDENPSFLSFPTWYKYLEPTSVNGSCDLDVQIPDDAGKILLAVFEIILRISGLAAVGFIFFGGYQYLLSQGEPERTKGAKSTILNAFIGLVITMLSVAIVNLIGRNIT